MLINYQSEAPDKQFSVIFMLITNSSTVNETLRSIIIYDSVYI